MQFKFRLRSYLLLLVLFNYGRIDSSFAQSRPYPFKQFPLPQDLPSVYCMLDDHDGYIWLGTTEGLYRYDGVHFTYYSGKDSFNGLGRELITYILEDRLQNLWIGARSGLYLYHPEKKDFEKFGFGDEIYPYYMHQENDSTFLVQNFIGIYFFYPLTNTWEKLDVGIEANKIYAAVRGQQQDIWIGTDELVRQYDFQKKTWKDHALIVPPAINQNERIAVHALFLDSRNQLWINTWFKGMIILDTDSGKSTYLDANPANKNHYLLSVFNPSMIEDVKGNVWLVSPEDGINISHPETKIITHIRKGADYGFGLIGNGLTIMKDRADNFWVKSDHALHYLSKTSPIPQMIRDDHIEIPDALFVDFLTPDFAIIGTFFGLFSVHLPTAKVANLNATIQLPPIHSAEKQAISDLLKTDQTTLVLASPEGLIKVHYEVNNKDIPEFHFPYLFKTQKGFWPSRLAHINDSTIFVKGRSNTQTFALFHLRNGKFQYRQLPDSLLLNQVATWNSDTMLFCIRNRGVYFYSIRDSSLTAIPWKFENEKIKIQKPVFLDIRLLENGQYAMSTENFGVLLFDPAKRMFEQIDVVPLSNTNVVYDVAEDGQHNLWIQASNQLLHYEMSTKTLSKNSLSNSFKGYAPPYFIHKGNEIFTTFEGGFYHIPLDQLTATPEKLKLYLQEIKAGEQVLDWENKDIIKLSYSDNFLNYSFTALDYENPTGVQYWYKIPEISEEWVFLDNQNSISLGRLPAGNYHFSVKASNSAGWWSDEVHAPVIRITPPFWSSWWFIALVAAFFAAVTGYLLRLRRMKAESELRLRNKIAKDLHDDIGSTLSGIRIFSGIATDLAAGHEELAPLLQKISDKSDTMMQSMSDIVWSINPRYDSLHDMVIRLKQFMNEVLEIQNIEVYFNSDVDLKNIRLDLQHRKEIFLSLKEIINNVAKHAKCRTLRFVITRQKSDLIFRITDDGIGMDENQIVPGNGLINIRDRIHQIGGTVIRKSLPGMGTSYEIRVGVV